MAQGSGHFRKVTDQVVRINSWVEAGLGGPHQLPVVEVLGRHQEVRDVDEQRLLAADIRNVFGERRSVGLSKRLDRVFGVLRRHDEEANCDRTFRQVHRKVDEKDRLEKFFGADRKIKPVDFIKTFVQNDRRASVDESVVGEIKLPDQLVKCSSDQSFRAKKELDFGIDVVFTQLVRR